MTGACRRKRVKDREGHTISTALQRVVKSDAYRAYGRVDLVEPADSGFILIAVEVERRPAFFPSGRKMHALVAECKRTCAIFEQRASVRSAITFKAFLVPPGKGKFLKSHPEVHVARFDLTVLVELDTVECAQRLRRDATFVALETRMRKASHYTYLVTARNVRRIGPVDHECQGVFFFNYFFADDAEQNLAVWDYTAGWFARETGLDNSTVLLPLEHEDSEYTLLNHCRWDSLLDFFPSLIFKRSFRAYVEANFAANHVAPIPVLYRMV